MKKLTLLLTVLIATATFTRAQTITAASTAQECVKFIEAMAQTYIGKNPNDKLTEISFNGSSFSEVSDYTSIKYKDNWVIANWADYDHLYISKPDKGRITILFYFKSESIKKEEIKIDQNTKLISRQDEGYKNYFSMQIPDTEQGKLKDLERAASRLAQMVKEKGNIFKTAATSTTSSSRIKNIEGKPSFQETVSYINTFLNGGASNDLFCNTVTFKNRNAQVGEHVNGGVYLTSRYLWEGRVTAGSPRRNESFRINLSQVEEIKIVTGEGFPGGCLQVGLWFVEKGKSATPVMHLPLWYTAYDTYQWEKFKEEKIYKAFNHLRKLCGAPEPISFD